VNTWSLRHSGLSREKSNQNLFLLFRRDVKVRHPAARTPPDSDCHCCKYQNSADQCLDATEIISDCCRGNSGLSHGVADLIQTDHNIACCVQPSNICALMTVDGDAAFRRQHGPHPGCKLGPDFGAERRINAIEGLYGVRCRNRYRVDTDVVFEGTSDDCNAQFMHERLFAGRQPMIGVR